MNYFQFSLTILIYRQVAEIGRLWMTRNGSWICRSIRQALDRIVRIDVSRNTPAGLGRPGSGGRRPAAGKADCGGDLSYLLYECADVTMRTLSGKRIYQMARLGVSHMKIKRQFMYPAIGTQVR